ncbi:MAG: hypothetical protein ACTHLU_09580 [Novosphingobium sp.]
MPRPRTNDPLGVSDNPPTLTDPARSAEVIAEFQRRAAYIIRHYHVGLATLGNDRAHNRSLEKLERSLQRVRPTKRRGTRAHPEVEMAITKFAQDNAQMRLGSADAVVTQEDANAGARKAHAVLKKRPGRGRQTLLRYHVEGMMALIQQTTGTPVLIRLARDDDYDPQPGNAAGELLVQIFQNFDPSILTTTLASMVKFARRKYASKAIRFGDFFPL